MPRAGVAGAVGVAGEAVLDQVDGEERRDQVAVAEDEVLVVLQPALAVEVDVEQLAAPQRLAQGVGVVEVGHLLVAGLGVQPDDVAVLELGDQRQGVPGGRQEDVAARLVRLGLQRDPQVVALRLDVAGDGVEALLVALHRGVDVLGAVVLAALAPAPHDEGRRTQLGGQVDRAQHLAQPEPAHAAVVGGQPAVLEHRVAEGVGGDHLDDQAGAVGGLA